MRVAAVASAHPLATDAGHEILAQGGNAFDAAVAVAAVLGVVEPHGSGLGGGGFWLLHRARDGFQTVVDARERAPLAARAGFYLDKNGDVVPRASLDGASAAAIPGQPAALAHIARQYGRLPLKQSLAPAIRHAADGFAVSERYRRMVQLRLEALMKYDPLSVFLDEGFVPEAGYRVVQPDLARTLQTLAARGHDGFYRGELAQRLVDGVHAAGGVWTRNDLAQYRVVERKPLRASYGRFKVTTVPPPGGGLVILETLNVLAPYALDKLEGAERIHTLVEGMRLAYRDRARVLGDPAYTRIDVANLLSERYAAQLRREVKKFRLPELPPAAPDTEPVPDAAGGTQTTHFSILDADGNRVAVTLSINGPFGAAFVVPGTGVLLNNEMDDFVAKPGAPNLYGLVGGDANAIAPGKRPLSSMSPSFVEDDARVLMVGTPGGSRIISMVLLATLDFMHGRGGLRDWLARPRFHHQYLPDVIEHEAGAFDEITRAALMAAGHRLKETAAPYGDMQAVLWDRRSGRVEAASDPRGEGAARVVESKP